MIGAGHFSRSFNLACVLQNRGSKVSFFCRELPDSLKEKAVRRGIEVVRYRITHKNSVPFLSSRVPSAGNRTDPSFGGKRRGDPRLNRGGIASLSACPAGRPVVARNDKLNETTEDMLEAAKETLTARHTRSDWIIFDGYQFDLNWERELKPWARHIMVIDDFLDKSHECDLFLNQSLVRNASDWYAGLLPPSCKILLGPHYALLGPNYSELRKSLKKAGPIKRLFVNFGASDPTNETLKVIQAIRDLEQKDLETDVVVGELNLHQKEIADNLETYTTAKLHIQPANLASLMAHADLAIGAGGVSLWERSCVGLPSIVITTAVNQREQVEAVAKEGKILYLGSSDEVDTKKIRKSLLKLLDDPDQVARLSNECTKLVDGKGAERVASWILRDEATLRPATAADSDNVLKWRNHPRIRQFSFSHEEIDAKAHKKWFANVLQGTDVVLLIAEFKTNPIAVLRYDLKIPEAKISIYVVPSEIGKGYGAVAIEKGSEWLKTNRPKVKAILAEVMPENGPSMRTFRDAGFAQDGLTFKKRL